MAKPHSNHDFPLLPSFDAKIWHQTNHINKKGQIRIKTELKESQISQVSTKRKKRPDMAVFHDAIVIKRLLINAIAGGGELESNAPNILDDISAFIPAS